MYKVFLWNENSCIAFPLHLHYLNLKSFGTLILTYTYILSVAWSISVAKVKSISNHNRRLLPLTTFENEFRNKWYIIWKPWNRAFRIRKYMWRTIILRKTKPPLLKNHHFYTKICLESPMANILQDSKNFSITPIQSFLLMHITFF